MKYVFPFLISLFLPLAAWTQNHILITEIVVWPSDAEFIEIYNPTDQTIDLSDYYITDATYAPNNTYYYNIVTGSNAGGGGFGDFHARFPAGATIAPGEVQTLAMNGSGFTAAYGNAPTYELYDTDANIPDMREAFSGSINGQGGLTNSGEVVILYYWDGSSNLVRDVDYVVWGDKAEAVDKTGVTIGGETYQPDTPISQQIAIPLYDGNNLHAAGKSVQRMNLVETDEKTSGGNGITGHDETSENLAASFVEGDPNPGSGKFVQVGDGTGLVTVSPSAVEKGQSGITLDFSIVAESDFTLESIALQVPSDWQWSRSGNDVQLSGSGFAAAVVRVNGDTVLVQQAAVTATDTGHIVLTNLTAPAKDTTSIFVVQTASPGGTLKTIANNPRVKVGLGVKVTPIAEIQLNTDQFLNKQVTITGVVTIGAGVTTTSWTDAYVQDNSGYGINVYLSGSVDTRLVRGNEVLITGTITEFQGITEITDYTLEILKENQPLPTPLRLQTVEATDVRWEGTYVEVEGIILDMYSAGGGTNISLDDGSGACLLRIWDSSNLNLSDFAVGDTVIARGAMDIYRGSAQILVGYQEDIFKPGKFLTGDGAGFASLSVQRVDPGQQNLNLEMRLWGTSTDTLQTVEILLPVSWQWSASPGQVKLSGSGFQGADKQVILDYDQLIVKLTDCFLTEQDTGTVVLEQFTAPSTPQYSYFWVKTAVKGGSPKFIAESPRVEVGRAGDVLYYQIRDLQLNSAQFTDQVVVKGVVTIGAGVLRTDRTSAYLQDASGRGINISRGGAPDTTYQRGRVVEVQGLVSEYRGVTQLTPVSAKVVDTGAELPPPIELSTREVNDPRWDGTWIQTRGVVTEKFSTSTSPPYDYNLVVNDGTGATTVRVWGTTGINLDSIVVNKAIIVEGVGSVFLSNNVPLYQILPAYQDNLRIDATYQPSLAGVSLEVPPYPFVPDRGETITIRYNAGAVNNHVSIRLFDTAGRLITTLLDENAQLVVNTLEWDGRDRFLNKVPLGTYLCLLEVVEPGSGKRITRMAPIVVGTILNK